MASYMMPISPMWTMIMTGSLSTLFSNLTWRIKIHTRCIWMKTKSYLAQVRLLIYNRLFIKFLLPLIFITQDFKILLPHSLSWYPAACKTNLKNANCNICNTWPVSLMLILRPFSSPVTNCSLLTLIYERQYYVSPEPSAELLMNMSRSRRLIVLLSHAYLDQDWCSNNFRSDSHGFIWMLKQTTLYILYLKNRSGIIVIHHMRSVLLLFTAESTLCPIMMYMCFQTGPSALVGDMWASHPHHVGWSVQTHEAWDQAAAQWASALPHHTHLEAQLRGKILYIYCNICTVEICAKYVVCRVFPLEATIMLN